MKAELYQQYGAEWVWVGQTTQFKHAEEWLTRRQEVGDNAYFVATHDDTRMPEFLREQAT